MINWRRFTILTILRTVTYSAVAAALCALFPVATPWIIAGGLGTLAIASKISYNRGKREARDLYEMGSESGDWGRTYGPKEKGKIEQLELKATVAIDKKLTAISSMIKKKQKASKSAKRNKVNNTKQNLEESDIDNNIDNLTL